MAGSSSYYELPIDAHVCYAQLMHRNGQYCPVATAAEILANRWTVLIVRELLADINHSNELERGLPHMSRALRRMIVP
jgi:DNA-binding HxlR family transcriptional regulator